MAQPQSTLKVEETAAEKAAPMCDTGLESFSRQRPGSVQSFAYTKTSTVITSQATVITEQPATPPRTLTFDPSRMDAVSLKLYSGLSVVHKSPAKVTRSVNQAGQQLAQQVDNTTAKLQDYISYDELLRTLVHENETILTTGWRLTYREAVFFDCETSSGLDPSQMPVLQRMPTGAAILTDQRLLLMSAQLHFGFSFRAAGGGKPRRYSLKAAISDNLHFKPIPLDNFRSIEMCAGIGAEATARIAAEKACCCGLCNWKCCGGCCYDEDCCWIRLGKCCHCPCCWPEAAKRWLQDVVSSASTTYNQRTIKLGLHLPPWGRKCMLHLELEPDLRLSMARDFIALLQKHRRLAA